MSLSPLPLDLSFVEGDHIILAIKNQNTRMRVSVFDVMDLEKVMYMAVIDMLACCHARTDVVKDDL